jgi:hypothetical protein
MLKTFACAVLLSFVPLSAAAQVDRAALVGTVRDGSGAIVRDAAVVVTSTDIGLKRDAMSGPDGTYRIAGLPVGAYLVTFSRDGFETMLFENVQLTVGQTRTLDATLSLGAVTSEVQVVAAATPLDVSTAEIGSVVGRMQVQEIPLNGRNWAALMALAPGAVNAGEGGQNGIRFFGRARDDNNWTFDGVDATGIKDPRQEGALRLVMSTEAIAEFRVNSTSYTAESGTGAGAQVNLVSRSGTNLLHGGVFSFIRDDAFDARRILDPLPDAPPFSLYQYGGTLGGPIARDRTFFFGSYEGLRQRLDMASPRPALVPSAAFRAQALAARPELRPVIEAYPLGTRTTSDPNIDEFFGRKQLKWDEDSVMVRVDHRFNPQTSLFVRYNRVDGDVDSEVRSDLLETRAQQVSPSNFTTQIQRVVSPAMLVDVKFGMNRSPLDRYEQGLNDIGFEIRNAFTPTRASFLNIEKPSSYSYVGNALWTRGSHSLKSGGEFRQVHVNVGNGAATSVRWNSIGDFLLNRVNRIRIDGELPIQKGRRWYGIGYVQDEYRVAPALTLNLGVRYEYYSVMKEAGGNGRVIDLVECPPSATTIFCPEGTPYYDNDPNNVAPRLGFAWSVTPATVVRGGYGIYYSTGQNDDVTAAIDSMAQRGELTTITSFPVEPFVPQVLGAANARPRAQQRDRRDMYAHQFSLSVQQEIGSGFIGQAAYVGSQGRNAFNRIFINTIDPVTGRRPAAPFITAQLDQKSAMGRTEFNGLQLSLMRSFRNGFLVQGNYLLGDSKDNNAGNGEGSEWMNARCGDCEWGPSDFDIRHSGSMNFVYQLPFAANTPLGGWDLSGVLSARSGRPVNVVISRTGPDGNDVNQRPNLVPGVDAQPEGQPAGWLNLAAFAAPGATEFGNAPRNAFRGPGLWQFDVALTKRTAVGDGRSFDIRVEAFNLFNTDQYGQPARNISEPLVFGLLAPANEGPTGSGTSRQLQFGLRFSF